MIGFLLLSRIAHKLAYYSVALGPFALGLLPLPRLLSRLAGRRHDAGVCRFAGDGISAGLLPGSVDRPDQFLVSGSQFAAVRLHAVQLLSCAVTCFRSTCCPSRSIVGSAVAAAVPGLFPGGRFLGQSPGRRIGERLGRRAGLGRVLHRLLRDGCCYAACSATADLEVEMPDQLAPVPISERFLPPSSATAWCAT